MSADPFVPDEGPWPQKSYKNLRFLNSAAAREIRVLCEFVEPAERFRRHGVRDTIVFFGSTRCVSGEEADAQLVEAEQRGDEGEEARRRLAEARRAVDMSRYYEDARALAHRITHWARSLPSGSNRFAVCSGGGPGIMEAANRGAQEAGGPSIGLNISLPLEQEANAFQTPELSFEFHYFFMRKFWFVYLARALVAFPGGFGTLDELFEVLTLAQTGKKSPDMPVIVYGADYWRSVINFDALVEHGTIAPEDLKLFRICDDVDTAFTFLRDELTRHYVNQP